MGLTDEGQHTTDDGSVMLYAPRSARNPKLAILPPFHNSWSDVERRDILAQALQNPHPTDILLDTSMFSIDRLPLVREILISSSPIVLQPVLSELEDLKTKARLAPIREVVFPNGSPHPRFRGDERRVFEAYPRFANRYINLLHWRRDAIKVAIRHAVRETGHEPIGKVRAKLIQKMVSEGVAEETIRLANKESRQQRVADEVLAVFSILSPILTGRDCFLYTADRDLLDQVVRMSNMLFDDYGAYLMARDFQNNGARYEHRHPWASSLFIGDALAVGRTAHPDYLLPPPNLVKTCATVVVDVARLRRFSWISARNMEAAISFQDQDSLGRKGDPGAGKDIVFTLPVDPVEGSPCEEVFHFGIGAPTPLRTLPAEPLGPVRAIDLLRAMMAKGKPRVRRSRIVSPFAAHQEFLMRRAAARESR
jgi:hypothetical protein